MRASQVAVSSRLMYPVKLASPEASTGSPYAKKTHPAATSAATVERLTRSGRQEAASPAAASPTTTGSARRAVPGIQVRKPAATTIAAYPRGSRSSGPARSPASRATSAPHPRHSAPSASGKTSQGTRRLTLAGRAYRQARPFDVPPRDVRYEARVHTAYAVTVSEPRNWKGWVITA